MVQAAVANLVQSLGAAVASAPNKPAFTFEGRSTTYAEFDHLTDRVAAALHQGGIRAGDRVAYVGKNSDLFFELLYGALKAGVVVVPVNWRLAAPEIAVIIEDCHSRLVVVGPEFFDLAEAILPDLPRVQTVLAAEGNHPAWQDFAAWRDAARGTPPAHTISANDVALQLYTSGTTGRPKGVMLSHLNFTHGYDAMRAADLPWNRWNPDDSAILAMPVSHISGSGWGILSVHHAATCHIQRAFDLDETFEMITRHRASKIFLVPAALQFLVRHPRAQATDFSCIREMGYGASPIPLALLRESMKMLGCGFVQFYGMTETTGTIVVLPPEDHTPEGSPRMRAAGKPLPWVDVRVVDATGAELPRNQVGEIATRSGANMVGYWNRPEETAKTIRDGWLYTGDAGFMDEDGYLYIHDRVKDMIITGGENVYPAEVESALSDHPAIAEVAVIGVPDSKWGEAVKAVVVLRPDAELTEDALLTWSRARIAGFKMPKTIDFAASLPRNAAGKLLKRELRAPYWEGRARQVN